MSKEEEERANFENFSRLSGQLFDRFESAKPPEPDVAAWRGNNQFGIEITRYYRQSEKAGESEKNSCPEPN